MQVLHVTTDDPAVQLILGIRVKTTKVEPTVAIEESKYKPAVLNDNPVQAYFGTPALRETFQLIVCKVISYETCYGTKYIVIFQNRDGNRAVWFASKEPKWAYDAEGCHVTVKATPKSHDESEKYGLQTILRRVNDVT